jgi:protein pelota
VGECEALIGVHASTAFKGALKEVMEAPEVMSQIKDTKAAVEVRALDDFIGSPARPVRL